MKSKLSVLLGLFIAVCVFASPASMAKEKKKKNTHQQQASQRAQQQRQPHGATNTPTPSESASIGRKWNNPNSEKNYNAAVEQARVARKDADRARAEYENKKTAAIIDGKKGALRGAAAGFATGGPVGAGVGGAVGGAAGAAGGALWGK